MQMQLIEKAKQGAGTAELDLHKTKRMKAVIGLFSWIVKERWVPPFLHIVTLGALQKGIDMVKNCCVKEGTDEQFHRNLYNQLHVIETHYHGGKFISNHVHKIVNSLEVITNLMWEHLAYNST